MLARAESLQSRDTIAQLSAQLASASDPPLSSSSSSSEQQQQQSQPQQDDHAVTAAEVAALAAQVAEQSAMVCLRQRWFVLFLKNKYVGFESLSLRPKHEIITQ